jgi:hypothetical protein
MADSRGGEAGATRRLLTDSVAQISQLPPGGAATGTSAFNQLRKGVMQASNGQTLQEAMLADLEPKQQVLHFLFEFYAQKKMYRKQIESVLVVLLKVNSWLCTLREDQALQSDLPSDLRALVQERRGTEGIIGTSELSDVPSEVAGGAMHGDNVQTLHQGTESGKLAAESEPSVSVAQEGSEAKADLPKATVVLSTALEGNGHSSCADAGFMPCDIDERAVSSTANCDLRHASPVRPNAASMSEEDVDSSEARLRSMLASECESLVSAISQTEVRTSTVSDADVQQAVAIARAAEAKRPSRPSTPRSPRSCAQFLVDEMAKQSPPLGFPPRTSDVNTTQSLLTESVEKLSQLPHIPPGSLELGMSAFDMLRRGVTQASCGQHFQENLLTDLEPKAPVLRFLIELYVQKKIHRKQVVSVFSVLMRVDSWRYVFHQDRQLRANLPIELGTLVHEKEVVDGYFGGSYQQACDGGRDTALPSSSPSAQHIPSGTMESGNAAVSVNLNAGCQSSALSTSAQQFEIPWPVDSISHCSQSKTENAGAADVDPLPKPSDDAVRQAVEKAKASSEAKELLDRVRRLLEPLKYDASSSDKAMEALETFRKAVEKGDTTSLIYFEPKGRTLKFVVAMYGFNEGQQQRIAKLLDKLWDIHTWQEAMQGDVSLCRKSRQILDKMREVQTPGGGIGGLSYAPDFSNDIAETMPQNRLPVQVAPSCARKGFSFRKIFGLAR